MDRVELLQVRPSRASDLEPAAALSAKCFARGSTVEELRGELASEAAAVWVAARGGRLVGYAVLRVVADEAELHAIGVAPEARGAGVATALLRRVLEDAAARGARAVHLEVRASNEAARRLYARAGFETVGLRRRYYADGEDARLMTRAR